MEDNLGTWGGIGVGLDDARGVDGRGRLAVGGRISRGRQKASSGRMRTGCEGKWIIVVQRLQVRRRICLAFGYSCT